MFIYLFDDNYYTMVSIKLKIRTLISYRYFEYKRWTIAIE